MGLFDFWKKKEQKEPALEHAQQPEPEEKQAFVFTNEALEGMRLRDNVNQAIKKDDVVALEESLKHTPYDQEFFNEAYYLGSPDSMRFFLEKDYVSGSVGISKLALEYGDLEFFKLAEQKGADIEGAKNDLLQDAMIQQSIPIAEYLLQKGADINYVSEPDWYENGKGDPVMEPGKTAIEFAATNNNSVMLDWAARHGGDMERLRGVELTGDCKDYADDYFTKKDFVQSLDAKLPEKTEAKPSFSDMVRSAVQQPHTQSGKRKI